MGVNRVILSDWPITHNLCIYICEAHALSYASIQSLNWKIEKSRERETQNEKHPINTGLPQSVGCGYAAFSCEALTLFVSGSRQAYCSLWQLYV